MEDSITYLNEKIEKSFSARGIQCIETCAADGRLLSDSMFESGKTDAATANAVLEEATGAPYLDPTIVFFGDDFTEHIKQLVPAAIALKEKVFPVKHVGNVVHLVMSNPTDAACIKRMEYVTGSRIKPYCCYTRGIIEAIKSVYGEDAASTSDGLPDDAKTLIDTAVTAVIKIKMANADVMEIITSVAVIRLLQFMLNSLAAKNTSDLHFECQEDAFKVRYRIDGVLQTAWSCPVILREALIPRLKLISGMSLDETVMPQDGSISYSLIKDRDIDLRVSALPSIYGEKIVLRLLDRGKERISLNDLGMDEKEDARLQRIIERHNVLILLTGPTGSGKTTTLYAILNRLNTDSVNIITAEDPVEYKLKGITQVSCTSENGLTFKDALKSFLRQDPDIIMVGEIRDVETADIALKSAMTGHLVLSTLHTNDAASAVNRLLNMGIPPYLAASAQISIIAQRLMRKLCNRCKEEYAPDPKSLTALGLAHKGATYYRARGCADCSGTGYNGREGIYELFEISDPMIELILAREPSSVLKAAAIEGGMTTLREAALKKLAAGCTTIEEVLRVTVDI